MFNISLRARPWRAQSAMHPSDSDAFMPRPTKVPRPLRNTYFMKVRRPLPASTGGVNPWVRIGFIGI